MIGYSERRRGAIVMLNGNGGEAPVLEFWPTSAVSIIVRRSADEELEASAVDVADFDSGVPGQILTKTGNIDVHASGDEITLAAPDGGHGRVPFQDLAPVPGEELEQVGFFLGQEARFPLHLQLPAFGIEPVGAAGY